MVLFAIKLPKLHIVRPRLFGALFGGLTGAFGRTYRAEIAAGRQDRLVCYALDLL
jgi:hypothetical protein